MKKLLYPIAFVLTAFLLAYSCSSEEEDTTPPPSVVKPTTSEPEPEPEVTQYTLTVTAGEGGTVSTEGGTYDEGTEVTITATPAEGYEFVGWEGSDSDSNSLSITLNGNTSIQALFTQNQIYKRIEYGNMVISQPSELLFNYDVQNHETDDYYISNKGWLSITSYEQHNGGYYGFDPIPPGYFEVKFRYVLSDDLNNDGREDMIFLIESFPHTVQSNQSGIPFFALISNEDGSFEYTTDYFDSNFTRTPHCAYKSFTSDFNGDGKTDFILGMRGIPIYNNDGSVDGGSTTPLLALSNENGYYDASQNLNGIYPGTVNNEDDKNNDQIIDFSTDRAMATGDFDGDGDVDLFWESIILLNDGSGNFTKSFVQLMEDFIPFKIDFTTNTYEAYSKDFNNDGFDDILIVPNGDFIVKYGGSGWIAMSDGTENFNNWNKLPLPDPRYLSNSNLNDINSIDFNEDGFEDLIIATTRREPYYRGAGIQLLKNNNGLNFIDVTEDNIEDQSEFDQWSGEGYLIVRDINSDSKKDIIHLNANISDGPPNEHHGTNIYINKNGYFEIYDTENKIPFTNWTQFEGYEDFIDDPNVTDVFTLDHAFPVNINDDGKIDFISYDVNIGNFEDPPPIKNVFYTIISK